MKKKATSSSSDRSSFQSLKEAKDFVDSSFEELLKQVDEFYKAIDPFLGGTWFGSRHEGVESLRLDPESNETRGAVLKNSKEQLRKLKQAILQSCSKICILDAFEESKEFFELISDQPDKWVLYLQEILDQVLAKQKNGLDDLLYAVPPARWLPSEIKQRAERERKKIIRGLPGLLAYQNSLEQSKPKKSRSSEAIAKERDYLFLLDQYEKWQAKRREDTGRKRYNPKDWLEDFDSWTSKSRRLFDKWAGSEEDPDEIVAIIKYAQKMKREREGSDE